MESNIISAIIGAIAVIIATIIATLVRRSQKRKRIRYCFLAGCGVGNRMALVPLPPGQNDVTALNEFIDALEKIGVRRRAITLVIKARDRLTSLNSTSLGKDAIKGITNDFFDTMSKVPDIVHSKTSKAEFRWFKFGELLYEVVTSAFLSNEGDERVNSTESSIIALESLVEDMNLKLRLRKKVNKFIEAAKSHKNPDQLMKSANQIGQIIYSIS